MSNLIIFDREEKKAILKKIEFFLQLICKICKEKNRKLIGQNESEPEFFFIILKKETYYISRIEEIEEVIQKKIKEMQTQMKISAFF